MRYIYCDIYITVYKCGRVGFYHVFMRKDLYIIIILLFFNMTNNKFKWCKNDKINHLGHWKRVVVIIRKNKNRQTVYQCLICKKKYYGNNYPNFTE